MSNTPTLPDADVAEPIPDETYDDDVVGVPAEDEDGIGSDLPDPANSPLPADVEPDRYDDVQTPI